MKSERRVLKAGYAFLIIFFIKSDYVMLLPIFFYSFKNAVQSIFQGKNLYTFVNNLLFFEKQGVSFQDGHFKRRK